MLERLRLRALPRSITSQTSVCVSAAQSPQGTSPQPASRHVSLPARAAAYLHPACAPTHHRRQPRRFCARAATRRGGGIAPARCDVARSWCQWRACSLDRSNTTLPQADLTRACASLLCPRRLVAVPFSVVRPSPAQPRRAHLPAWIQSSRPSAPAPCKGPCRAVPHGVGALTAGWRRYQPVDPFVNLNQPVRCLGEAKKQPTASDAPSPTTDSDGTRSGQRAPCGLSSGDTVHTPDFALSLAQPWERCRHYRVRRLGRLDWRAVMVACLSRVRSKPTHRLCCPVFWLWQRTPGGGV